MQSADGKCLESSRAGEILTQGQQYLRRTRYEGTTGRGDSGSGQARLQHAPCTVTMQDEDKATRLEARQAEGGTWVVCEQKRRVTCARVPKTTNVKKRGQVGLAQSSVHTNSSDATSGGRGTWVAARETGEASREVREACGSYSRWSD